MLRLAQRLARRGELEFATEVVLRELEFAPGDTAARNELALLWVRRGELEMPTSPGLGFDIDERVLLES